MAESKPPETAPSGLLRTFGGLSRRFLDWMGVLAPLDHLGLHPPPVNGADRDFAVSMTASLAQRLEGILAQIGASLEGIDLAKGDRVLLAMLPAYIGFRAPFWLLIQAWGFERRDPDPLPGGGVIERYTLPDDVRSTPPPHAPLHLIAMERAVEIMERLVLFQGPFVEAPGKTRKQFAYVQTPRGLVPMAKVAADRLRTKIDGGSSAVFLDDVRHDVTEEAASFVEAILRGEGSPVTVDEMMQRFPILWSTDGQRPNTTRLHKSLPPGIRRLIRKPGWTIAEP